MAKTKWEEYVEKNKVSIEPPNYSETKEMSSSDVRQVRPWDFLNPNTEYASDEVANKRFDACLGCDKLIKLTKQCKECGCFMNAKTKLAGATCPLGKW